MIISIVDSATGWDSSSSQIMTSILVVVVVAAGSTRSRGRFSRTGACKLTNTVHCGWVIWELKGVSLIGSL